MDAYSREKVTSGDSLGVYTYDYDSLGRLLSMWQWNKLGRPGTNLWSDTQDYDTNNWINVQS